jgi:hypothetical protein
VAKKSLADKQRSGCERRVCGASGGHLQVVQQYKVGARRGLVKQGQAVETERGQVRKVLLRSVEHEVLRLCIHQFERAGEGQVKAPWRRRQPRLAVQGLGAGRRRSQAL